MVHDSDLWICNDSHKISGYLNGFQPGTEITMADGSKKPVENVKIGDWVRSYNTDEKVFEKSIVKEINCSRPKYGYYTINEYLLVTGERPLYTKKSDTWTWSHGKDFNFTFPESRKHRITLTASGWNWEPILPVPSTSGLDLCQGIRINDEASKIIDVGDVCVDDLSFSSDNFDELDEKDTNNAGSDDSSTVDDQEDSSGDDDDGSTSEDQDNGSEDGSDEGENSADEYQPSFFELLLSLIRGEINITEFIQALLTLIEPTSS